MPIKPLNPIFRRIKFDKKKLRIIQKDDILQVWAKETEYSITELEARKNAYISMRSKVAALNLNKVEFETLLTVLSYVNQRLDPQMYTMGGIAQQVASYIQNQIDALDFVISLGSSSSSSSSLSFSSSSSSSSSLSESYSISFSSTA